jgi:catechol 2,3-dioxygenase-like lactoylglutathione lyase family enzyme
MNWHGAGVRALAASVGVSALAGLSIAILAAQQPAPAPAAIERPPILGIARVALRVSAIAPARAFYADVLGLLREGPEQGACVRFRVNARQDIAIEPGLPADEDERLAYLAFETPGLDALAAYFKSRGIAVDPHPPTGGCAAASRALWVKDPDGHPIAFVEPQHVATTNARAISTRVLHAGLTIRDPDAADTFYKDVLGFSEIWRGGRTDGVTSWINMRVPNGTDYLEYMLVSGPVNRQQRGTLHHVALLVPDIQIALETARERTPAPARAKLASPQVGRNNRWQLNLFDPDGTRIELMEPFPMRSR